MDISHFQPAQVLGPVQQARLKHLLGAHPQLLLSNQPLWASAQAVGQHA